jgi:uncharacterized protein YidB (DUF937 family)
MSPVMMAALALLAYRGLKGKNLSDMFGGGGAAGGGGLGDMLGRQTGGGGLGGMLGGLLGGGALGGILSGGLGDLLKQFQTNGQGDKAESWVSSGANKPVLPNELEQALGQERLQWLMEQTGMGKEELLAGLSQELPQVVDKLTPDGRIPNDQEAARLVA